MSSDWDGAIEQFRLRGVCRSGEYEDGEGRVCLLGAVLSASGELRYDDQLLDDAAEVLAPIIEAQFPDFGRCEYPSGYVIKFNDYSRATDDDLLLVLEKARGSSWA